MDSSDPTSKLCSSLLREYFNETVSGVAMNLMKFGVKTLGQIVSSSEYSVKDVKKSLALLVEHNLVTFSDKRRPGMVDYKISKSAIINLLNYSVYISLLSGEQEGKDIPPSSASDWGLETSVLLQVLLVHGRLTASQAVLEAYKLLKDAVGDESNVEMIWKSLIALCSNGIIEALPLATKSDLDIPQFLVDENKPRKNLPKLNLAQLENAVLKDNVQDLKDELFWRPDFQVLSQKFRDSIIWTAAVRRIDATAGRIVRSVLDLSAAEGHDPWSTTSGFIGLAKITDRVKKDWGGLVTHLDQYLNILSSDRTRFVSRMGDAGGGQFQVNYKHIFEEIAGATVEQIVLERFGSKSMRVFRYIKETKYAEENSIQEKVMINSKDLKLLIYQLMENNFVCLQELKKSVTTNVPSKAIYLFYVNFDQVLRYCINLCLQSIYNVKQRSCHEFNSKARLHEKKEKVEAILESVRAEGGTEEQLAEVEEIISPPEREELAALENKTAQCTLAQMKTSETLFILQTCLRFKQS